jgi:hypothetical protein
MTWVLWRQHRLQAAIFTGMLALIAVLVLKSGSSFHDQVRSLEKICPDRSCGSGGLHIGPLYNDVVRLTLALPLVLGVFMGSTLVSREVEQRTNTLAWTQGLTRRQWLAAKFGFVLAFSVVLMAAVSALVTWWYDAQGNLLGGSGRFDPSVYELRGLMPVAYTVFAVGLGLFFSSVLRRTVPALGATLGVWMFGRLAFTNWIRPTVMKPIVSVTGAFKPEQIPMGSWEISNDLVNSSGHVVRGFPIEACGVSDRQVVSRETVDSCMAKLGFHSVTKYQPATRYWHFVTVETASYVGVALILMAVAYWYTLRRDA